MQHLIATVGLLLLWLVFASPLLLGLYLIARALRRRRARSAFGIVPLAAVFALLAAPVPTPVITVLVPHVFALADPSYYAALLHGPDLFAQLWPWIFASLGTTFVLASAVCWWYVRRARIVL